MPSAQAVGNPCEQSQRFGVGVVAAPRIEAGATEVDVAADLFRDLLRGTDEIARAPRLGFLAEERARARVEDLSLGLADEPLGRDRLADLVVVAADVLAVLLEPLGLVLPLVRLAAEVRRVGESRDDAQRELLAAAADEDLGVRLLQRLGVALRAREREVLPLVAHVGLRP